MQYQKESVDGLHFQKFLFDSYEDIFYSVIIFVFISCVECKAGRYGKNCLLDCNCGGGSCHPNTGVCDCRSGKMGLQCNQGT